MGDPTPTPAPSDTTGATSSVRWWLILPMIAALISSALLVRSARVETPTVDEMAHIASGMAVYQLDRLDVYWRSPPLGRWWITLPVRGSEGVTTPLPPMPLRGWGAWAYSGQFMQANAARYLDLVFLARLMVIPLVWATGAMVFCWARRLWGVPAAAIVTSLYFWCPNTLAHGHLGTLDTACTMTTLLAMFTAAWAMGDDSLTRRGGWWRIALVGAALGLALAIKFTAMLLVPVVLVLIVARRWAQSPRPSCGVGARALWTLRDCVIVLAMATLIVNASIGFRDTCRPIGQFEFGSRLFQRVQAALPASLPIPAPASYVSGADDQQASIELGEFRVYLRGEWSDKGWWYYNFVALAVKTPEPFLILLVAATLCWRPINGPRWREALALLAAPAAILMVACASGKMNIGLRYVLPAMPFLFIAIGAPVRWLLDTARPRAVRVLPGAVAGYWLVTSLVVAPSHLGYFNPLSGGPSRGHEWLLDSNLDWGQDLHRLPAALRPICGDEPIYLLYFGHCDPAVYGVRYRLAPPFPVRGVIAVSVNFLLGQEYVATHPNHDAVTIESQHLRWLRGLKPVAKAGTIWIYDTRNLVAPPPTQ